MANATYAVGFLTRLYAQLHLWATAASAYHSQTPGVSEGYVRRVVAAWPLAVRYVDASVLSAIAAGAGASSPGGRIEAARTCTQPDLSRYTPEFRQLKLQALLDHARLLTEMGLAHPAQSVVGCAQQPGAAPRPSRLRSARGTQIPIGREPSQIRETM